MKNKSIKFLMGFFLLISYFNVQSQNCSINAGAGGEICEGAEFKLDGSGDANIKPGTILWTQIAGPTVGISDPTAYQPNITGATGGNTYKFRLTAVCTDDLSTFQDVVYTVKPSPTATAGTDITNCPGTYSLAANTPSVGYTGTWTIIGSNGAGLTITNSNSPTSIINLPQESSGATILEWRISDGDNTTCDGVSRITVTNIGGDPVVSAGTDQVLKPCFDATTTATLDGSYGGNGFNGQEGLWELVSGPNNPEIKNVNKKDTKVNDLIEGTYVFRWTVSGPCASGTSTVSVTVPSPTGSVTSADSLIDDDVIRICHSDTNPTTEYLLVANPPKKTGETVEWTQVSGPGGVTIVNPNSPTTLVTGLSQTAGGNANLVNYTFRYTVKGPDNNSDCFKTKDVRIKFIKQPLFVELTDDGTPSECIFATLDSSGSVDVKFGINRDNTGSNTRYKILSGPVTTSNYVGIGANSSGNSSSGKDLTLTFTEIGTYVVGVLRRPNGDVNNGCENAADEITVKISGPATNANAGSDIYVCTPTTTATLAGNTPVQGEGMWSQVSGPNTAVISDVFDRNAELSSLVAGAYVFRWSINSGPTSTIDPLDSDEVSVIVSTGPPSHPANFAGTDVNVCAGSYQLQSPALLVNEAGRWTVSPSAGVTIVDDTDPKTLVMGLSPLTVYTFTYTISNACGSINDSVIVSTTGNTSPSTANAGSDICLTSGTSTTLNATAITAGEMGTWTQVSGPNTASFSDVNSASTSITGLVPGNYEFKWRITNTSCPLNITEDTVIVSLLNSVPSAGADQDICGASTITMAADANPNGGGTWVQTFGPAGWTVTDITSPTAMFSNLSDGKYEFEWRVSSANCFINDKVVFTITNTPTVASVAAPTIASCSNTATLNANPVTVGVGKWVWVSGPNTPSINDANSPTATISGLVTGMYEYKWTSSPLYPSADPTCNLGSSADLTINVVAPANAGNDQDLCAANEVLLQGTVGSTGTWSFQSSTGVDTPTPIAINANMAKATIIPGNNYVFTYTLTIPGGSSCVGSSDDVTINNALTNTASITTTDQSLCLPTSSVSVTAAEVSGTWTYRESLSQATSSAGLPSAASIGISNPNAQTTTITGLTNPGIYIFRWTTGSGDCQKLDEITITVHEAPSTADAGQAAMNLCVLDARLAATAPTSGLGTWSFVSGTGLSSGDVVFDSPNSPTSTLTLTNANAGDTAILRWTVSSGGCTPSTDDITITIVESITATLSALSSVNSCQGANNGSLSATGSGGVAPYSYNLLYATSSGGVFIEASQTDGDSDGSYTGLQPGFYKIVLTDSQNCGSVTSAEQEIIEQAQAPLPVVTNRVYCEGTTADPLSMRATGSGVLTWYDSDATTVLSASTVPSTASAGVKTYYVSNTVGVCVSAKVSVTITVNEAFSIDTQPAASTTVCKDGAVTLNVAASGGVGSLSYQWQSATSLAGPYSDVTSGTGGTTASYSPVTSTEGTLYYQVVVSNAGTGCTSITSSKSTVTVNALPTIDTQPTASTTVCKDGAVTLNVAASGGVGSLSYQWQSATSLAGPYSDVTTGTGGTTASYSPVTSTEGTLYYQVVVSNAGTGCTSITSSKSTVTVNALPTIDTEPAASTTVCKDGAVTLNVAASGGVGSLTYQWQSATSLAGPYSDVTSGTGGTTANYSPVTSTEGTLYYQVVVSNAGIGCTSVTSNKSTVIVNQVPTIDTEPAASTTVCKDGAVTLNVAASGGVGSLTYQWQSATSLAGPYSDVTSGTGGATASYSPVTSTEGTLYYQVVVSNAGTGCTSVTSNKSTVIVNQVPTIDTEPAASTTVCKDGTVTLSVAASGGVGSLTYQWQSATSLAGPYSDVTSGTGGTTASYSPVTSTEGTLYYQVVVSNAGTGCTSVTSNKSTVIVNQVPTIDTEPAASMTVCKDGTVTLSVAASGGVGSLTYQWQSATSLAGPYSDVTSGTGGTTASYSPVTSTEGTLYYQVVVSNAGIGCTSVTSSKSTVTVNALPTIDTEPAANTTVCKDGAVTLSVAASGGVGSLTYQWQSATSLAGPYSDVTSGTGGTTANYSPVTSTEGTLYYQVVVSNAGIGCTSVTSSKSTVTVNALPTIDTEPAASTTVCKDGAVTLNVAASGGVGSLTYQWQSATSLAGPYSDVTSGTGGTTANYSPVTSTEGTLYYQVVVSNAGTGCTSITSSKSTVTVNALPTIDTEPAANTTVCKDGAVTLSVAASGGVGSLTYQWQSATSLAGPYSDVTSGTGGTTANYSPVTSTEGTLYYQVVVSNAGTGCTSVTSSKSTVTVNALPTIDTEPAASTTVCKDGAVTLNVAASGGVGSLTYQWQSATSLAGPYSDVTSGTGGTTANYSPVTSTEGTLYYQVVVSNAGTGCTSITSSKSTVTVNALPTIDTEPAASTTVCKDGTVTLSVMARGGVGSLTYQWQSATSLAGPYSDVTSGTGGTTASYSPVTSTEGTLYYQVVVSNAGIGCTSVTSNKSTVIVNQVPTIDTEPAASTTVCKDGTVTLNVAASGGVGSLTYQWQSATSLAGPYSDVTSGTGGATASYSPVTSTEGTLYYQVVVSNAGIGCTSVISSKSTVIVNEVPTINSQPMGSTTVCKDGAVTLSVAASGGVGSLTYQWQSATSLAGPYSDVTSGTGGTTASYSPVTSTEGTLYYQVVVSNAGIGCTSVTSSKSTVIVNQVPTIDTQPASSTTVCKDGAVTLNVAASGGVGSLSYQWQSATSLTGPYSDVTSGTGGTTASYSPVTSTEGTLYYQVVVSNAGTGCTSVTSSKSAVIVNQVPTIDTEPAASTTVCKDGAVTLNVAASGGVGSLTYQWQSATSLAGPYSDVTSGTGGTTASYSPVTSTEGTLYYQVVVSNAGTGCTSVT
ncbi:hypothetical protein L1265_06990, partial [Tenacibaculum sp. Cn5-1]|uniref:PKD domain-containing protein n=1 Tax=Tenacibaculum sp. Cn5-1 TaxID=2908884 RepID=UPI001F424E0E